MNRYYNIGLTNFIAALLLILVAGCTRNSFDAQPSQSGSGDEVLVSMHVMTSETRANSITQSVEDQIKSIRVMVFVAESDNKPNGRPAGYLLENIVYSELGTAPVLKLSSGLRDFYVVANETPQMTAKLNRVNTISQLKQIAVGYDDDMLAKEAPFVMFQQKKDQVLKEGGTADIDFQMVRLISKVRLSLSFNATTVDLSGGLKGRPLNVDSIRIIRVSDSSNLVVSAPVYVGTKQRQSRVLSSFNTPNSRQWTITDSLYVTERIFADPAQTSDTTKSTYIMVYANSEGVACRYRIDIGDKSGVNVTKSDYTISRNTQYNVVGNFTKIGETDGVDVDVSVKPWDTVLSTDKIGVLPTITKDIVEFTPCDGRAEFSVALDEKAYWEVKIDNATDFGLYGKIKNGAGGDNGGLFNIVPRKFTSGVISKTNVQIVVNGQTIDESVVTINGNWKFEPKSIIIDNSAGRLVMMDRNMGASSPKGKGCVYKFGSLYGINANTPTYGVAISSANPLITWNVDKTSGAYNYGVASAYSSVPYQSTDNILAANDPCPNGWHVPNAADYAIINQALTTNKSYGDFSSSSISGRILIDFSGNETYLPATFNLRNTSGVLTESATTGYYSVRNNGFAYALKSTGSFSAPSYSPANAVMVRCVEGEIVDHGYGVFATGNIVIDGAGVMQIGTPSEVGLLFKYGSIVALASRSFDNDPFSADDVLWAPNSNVLKNSKISWTSVPRASENQAITTSFHSVTNVMNGLGDPCRMVGLTQNQIAGIGVPQRVDNGIWRLPRADELSVLNPNNIVNRVSGNYISFRKPAISMRYNGWRYNNDGEFYNSTRYFIYRSSNVGSAGGAVLYYLETYYYGVSNSYESNYAYGVRCVGQ